jgi:hypothetical protein
VVGTTIEIRLHAEPCREPADDRIALQVGRLVDVQLKEAPETRKPLRRSAQPLRVDSGGGHRVGERNAGIVAASQHVIDVQSPE